jgi:hypothetical protein
MIPICFTPFHLSFKTSFRVLASALMLAGLVACGGGSSSTSGGNPDVPPVTPFVPTVNPGAYIGTVNTKDWITILRPTAPAIDGVTQYLALHYNATDPDIYSGSGRIAGINTATLSTVSLFPDNAKPLRTGTGTVTGLYGGMIRTALNFPTAGTEIEKNLSFDHSPPSGFNYTLPATTAAIQGVWSGRWSYSVGASDNFTLNVSAQGDVTSSMMFQNDCRLTQGRLDPNFDGLNLYSFSVTFPNATVCTSFGGQSLTGAAFVTPSPVAGKTQRLYLVGITSDGRGISFKADR